MTERWLPVDGYEGRYEVSDQGRVRSWAPYNGQPVPRILSPGVYASGHLHVGLSRRGELKTHAVHRLVMEAFVGPRPKGQETRHLDGNPANNALTNLDYGTKSENMADRIRHGVDPHASRDQCHRGHPYTPENTHVRSNGHRVCRTCSRMWGAKTDAKRRRKVEP